MASAARPAGTFGLLGSSPAAGSSSVPLLDWAQVHHIGIVVPDTDAAAARFAAVYGAPVGLLPESEYICRIDGVERTVVQRLGMSVGGPPHVELLRAIAGTGVWEGSGGVHHVGFVVDDVPTASAELERRGAPLWMGGVSGGSCPAGTAYHHGPGGVTIELLDHATRDGLADRLARATDVAPGSAPGLALHSITDPAGTATPPPTTEECP